MIILRSIIVIRRLQNNNFLGLRNRFCNDCLVYRKSFLTFASQNKTEVMRNMRNR